MSYILKIFLQNCLVNQNLPYPKEVYAIPAADSAALSDFRTSLIFLLN